MNVIIRTTRVLKVVGRAKVVQRGDQVARIFLVVRVARSKVRVNCNLKFNVFF